MKKSLEKTRYSDNELEEFRKVVMKKLVLAKEQIENYKEQLKSYADTDDVKVKGLDDGQTAIEMERITELAVRQRKLIEHLENALSRIDNKVYGVCRVSGKLISRARLMAVPHATLSIEAKKNQ